MPTDPTYAHADVSHPRMVVEDGWIYGCHSDVLGPEPRGRTRTAWVQDGWRTLQRGEITTREPVMIEVTTKWNPLGCGHVVESGRGADPQCDGCVWEKLG